MSRAAINTNSSSSADSQRPRSRLAIAFVIAWAVLLAVLQCRSFFVTPREAFWANHDGYSYPARLVEFEDSLAQGILSPQWCSHFRGGLGSPYFNYYQPGLFYVASLFPRSMSPTWRLGVALVLFSLAGFAAVYAGLQRRCGAIGGLVGGTFLLTAPYGATEILIRGDFSEYAGMMLVPVLAWTGIACGERRDRRTTAWMAFAGGALIVTHPVVALLTYGFGAIAVVACAITRPFRSAAPYLLAGLSGGVLVASFYWLPHFNEVKYVAASQATDGTRFDGFFHYSKHFVRVLGLVDFRPTDSVIPLKFGRVPTLVLLASAGATLFAWRRLSAELRWQFALGVGCATGCIFLMSSLSEPLWRGLPLLHKIQFPWRIYSVLTPVAAWLAGAWPRLGRPAWRGAACLACVAALTIAGQVRPSPTLIKAREIRRAEELATFYFAPDVAGEWMPLDGMHWAGDLSDVGRAQHFLWPDAAPPAEIARPILALAPEPGPGVTIGTWSRRAGTFACEVRAEQDSFLVLPQLYFPLGWRASLDGRVCEIRAANDGLLQVRLPGAAVGRLELKFFMTPARRWGWMLSLAGIVSLAAGACMPLRTRVARAEPGIVP